MEQYQENCHKNEGVHNKEERGSWANKTEYLLSCAGYAIGIGNVWRFPYLCYRNGGGAFLLPYVLMLFLCGIPLFFLETSIGQFGGVSCITMFRMCPLFRGAGFAIVIVNAICSMYYNVVIAYPILFTISSISSKLPWEDCSNSWNTEACLKLGTKVITSSKQNETLQFVERKSPADEFFHNHVLKISSGFDQIGGIVWPLFWCNLFSWIVILLCIREGVQTVGKVVYFTATFPLVIFFVLLIRGVTLPGAFDGILFYILPEWSQLMNLQVWADAAIQIFFSLGPGWGTIVNMASYNNFRNNNCFDSILMPIVNGVSSVFAGFVVFSVLGFMSHTTGLPISNVATSGPGLAFVTYPEALAMLPLPQLWSVLFFLMFYFLGVNSLFVQIEAVISSVTDAFPKLRKHKQFVTIASIVIFCLGSTLLVTNGGMYYLQLLDWYAVSISVISICLVEVVMVSWIYGSNSFLRDIKLMTGKEISCFWPICWKFVNPIVLLFIFVTTILFNTRITYNGISYPDWSITLGWASCLISIICIPAYVVYYFFKSKGTFMEKLKISMTATEEWGPQKENDRLKWNSIQMFNTNTKE